MTIPRSTERGILLRKWRDVVSAAGWPATADGWAVVSDWHKAENKVGSAPWQFPADRSTKPDSWPPWELPSL